MDKRSALLTVVISVTSVVISVISFVMAFWTFYFTYWYPGELDFTPPDRIGVSYGLLPGYNTMGMSIIIPITFTNTGSTRFRSQVYALTADVSTISAPEANQTTFHTRWEYEVSYISSQDYFNKYQDWMKLRPKKDLNLIDQLIYQSRAVPFQVTGGAFVSKLYLFEETQDMHVAEDPSGREATLELKLRTNSNNTSNSWLFKSWFFKLKLPEKLDSEITYVPVNKISNGIRHR